ncbi:MAG: hypothetical protein K8U03_05935 [Planctomycetia bacterium]|nr:hypothetical protein [Planctomycetia bacterium]
MQVDEAFDDLTKEVSLAIAEGQYTTLGTCYGPHDVTACKEIGLDRSATISHLATLVAWMIFDCRNLDLVLLEDLEIAKEKLKIHWVEAHLHLIRTMGSRAVSRGLRSIDWTIGKEAAVILRQQALETMNRDRDDTVAP